MTQPARSGLRWGMSYFYWGLLAKPLVLLLIGLLVCLPTRWAMRYFPDGKLKRILLTRLQ
jgi:hypothetical protein